MTDDIKRRINAARLSFNDELLSADYPRIHGDQDQVARLVDFLAPRPGGAYLDLGTGNGTVAFAIAERHPDARVIGVDIADQAIARNRKVARELGRANVAFDLADGQTIDHPAATFHGIASRYALHHFPDVEATLADMRRVLHPDGSLAISDAIRHPSDDFDFVNRFQALKPDGHVKIYSAAELAALFSAQGFEAAGQFGSRLSFTRELNDDYRRLIERTPPEILQLYEVHVEGAQAALTFEILTLKFVPLGS